MGYSLRHLSAETGIPYMTIQHCKVKILAKLKKLMESWKIFRAVAVWTRLIPQKNVITSEAWWSSQFPRPSSRAKRGDPVKQRNQNRHHEDGNVRGDDVKQFIHIIHKGRNFTWNSASPYYLIKVMMILSIRIMILKTLSKFIILVLSASLGAVRKGINPPRIDKSLDF